MVQHLRDLAHSLGEYPAEWSDDLLAEVANLAVLVRGMAETERLTRALTVED